MTLSTISSVVGAAPWRGFISKGSGSKIWSSDQNRKFGDGFFIGILNDVCEWLWNKIPYMKIL